MAKKNIRSESSSSAPPRPVPERRRTVRATSRSTAKTPATLIAEPDGSPSIARDTASDVALQGAEPSRTTPSYEEIAEAAYHRYLQRGGQHGHDFDDWVDAERALRARQ